MAPDAGRAEACRDEPDPDEPGRAGFGAVRAEPPVVAPPTAPSAPTSSVVQFLNMKYCWPSVHRLVVTQYSTRPYCQYSPVSEKNGTMYCMNFCDWAIGLSGSMLVCMRPRFALCRTVMNVVVALTTTVSAITMATCSDGAGCANSSLSSR